MGESECITISNWGKGNEILIGKIKRCELFHFRKGVTSGEKKSKCENIYEGVNKKGKKKVRIGVGGHCTRGSHCKPHLTAMVTPVVEPGYVACTTPAS